MHLITGKRAITPTKKRVKPTKSGKRGGVVYHSEKSGRLGKQDEGWGKIALSNLNFALSRHLKKEEPHIGEEREGCATSPRGGGKWGEASRAPEKRFS